MENLFDSVSQDCSRLVTNAYSTSFSMATKMLDSSIRNHIYNLYGFVRFADEIVDTFHKHDKEKLLNDFEIDLYKSLNDKISINPILNSFQYTVNLFNIDHDLIHAFMKSMRLDLSKQVYETQEEYKEYIYGSADVVGLMCLKVFVKGDDKTYEELKTPAMALGSAFQKVNFLRDLKEDFQGLDRTYFPNVDFTKFDEHSKSLIIQEIEADFNIALEGIFKLPTEARFGVYTAYKYYTKLLSKLKKTPSLSIQKTRIRVPNYQKISVLARSYLKYRLNLL
ncbi:MAG: phytoene/squalene synthase family protein [Flavobacteriaceae bacterium]|jgi:phytoene synthase|nr:phytoene/squalene synthase family protein [Flavobacteriaceae bacterium]MBT4312735.1 phytoene/squalene synthase family protein [Flavobacteriaceae bacterium]MBT5091683.1 phytoene/squalene synthase family protein [Flavobacteriaceae bacterium]MBT5283777.1 phytoene/squalene synthase family protein [Flavobacteriaceae bacterium]MBT5447326.1 phytoene/squalene synthase family protein [Flavobacteriaceae bacterium]|tara:strand:+ start:1205 stop:2044 length:840 start_codon:yes stop_codon:yes gene_type:complete